MTPIAIGINGLLALFILLFLGIPVGVSLGMVAVAGLWVLAGDAATLLKMAVTPFRLVASYDLSVLPLFLFMAEICAGAGISRDLYNLAGRLLGRFPGGIAMASTGACAGFAAISSSAVACAATMGSIAIPEMKRFNYDGGLAAGTLAAGGTLGILIPPSFMFILYGILTETSIGKLFMAGFIPGVLQAFFYIVAIYIVCRHRPSLGPRGPVSTFREKMLALLNCVDSIGLIVLVLLGITLGWFTPTEAGAVGAAGAVLFSLLRRRLTWRRFVDACVSTMKTTGMVFLILIGAYLFTYFVTLTNIPMALSNWITALKVPPMAVVWLVVAMYLVLGTAMEEASMMLLTIPIFTPIMANLGFDKVWFGIICTRMMQVAMISPPVGITLFVIKGIAKDVPMSAIYRGVLPFIAADTVHVTLLIFVPWLTMFLPSLM